MRIEELKDFRDYGVTEDGRVWSIKSGKWRELKPQQTGDGYTKVNLYCVEVRNVKVHCLVAAAFLGPRPEGLDVNHKNGRRSDNRVANLEYVTRQQNVQHSHIVLRDTPGRRHRIDRAHARRRLAQLIWLHDARSRPMTKTARRAQKLTVEDVLSIREHASARTMTRWGMVARYNVSKNTIDRIISRDKWAHV